VTEFVRLATRGEEQEGLTAELQVRTAQMEADILQRSQELHLANARLRAASDAKSEFLSRMSHELRTPLNAILGFTQLLEMQPIGDRERDFVAHISRAGRHLLGLVDEVLDITRVETGHLRLSLEPVCLREVLDAAVGMVGPLAEARSVSLTIETSPEVDGFLRADRQRLQQVVVNLLANAVKYNRDGGSVTVRARGAGSIEVVDTGIGIAPDHLDKLFSPFERLGAEQSDVEGTGLGLALTKHLVEAMEGEISVESREGHGSTFRVELPSCEPAGHGTTEAEPDLGHRPPEVPTARTVLYVEDNLSNVRLVEEIFLHRPEVTLLIAMSGALALDIAREQRPDVVLLDLHLPDMGGEDVLSALRADPSTAGMTIIVLSADATQEQARKLIEKGASYYLTKPFEIPTLLQAIDGAPARARAVNSIGGEAGPLDGGTLRMFRELAGSSTIGGNRIAELIATYIRDAASRIASLELVAGAGDLAEVRDLAHSLAGSSVSFGARTVGSLARDLDRAAKYGDVDGVRRLVDEIDIAFALARDELRAEFLTPLSA
jgi:CheY-like chemotaxis protein/nitrogen-specific signal transduction histidine kinase/HPt (histidine-containing phosphotransfer) domain-containing protein